MASRFGRRQRRKAREQIAAQAHHIECQAAAIRSDRRKLADQQLRIERMAEQLKDWDDRIRSMLGEYTSAGINDTTFRVDHPDRVREMPIIPPLDVGAFLEAEQFATIPDSLTYYVEKVLHIVADLEREDHIRLSRRLSFWVDADHYRPHHSKEAVYGISQSQFEALMRDGERGVRILARTISKQIAAILLRPAEQRRRA